MRFAYLLLENRICSPLMFLVADIELQPMTLSFLGERSFFCCLSKHFFRSTVYETIDSTQLYVRQYMQLRVKPWHWSSFSLFRYVMTYLAIQHWGQIWSCLQHSATERCGNARATATPPDSGRSGSNAICPRCLRTFESTGYGIWVKLCTSISKYFNVLILSYSYVIRCVRSLCPEVSWITVFFSPSWIPYAGYMLFHPRQKTQATYWREISKQVFLTWDRPTFKANLFEHGCLDGPWD